MSKINKISVDGAVYDIEDASVPGWAKGVDKPTYKTSELENDSNYVTEAQMNERISNIEISGGVDLSNYATKEYVDEQISNIEISDGGTGGSGTNIKETVLFDTTEYVTSATLSEDVRNFDFVKIYARDMGSGAVLYTECIPGAVMLIFNITATYYTSANSSFTWKNTTGQVANGVDLTIAGGTISMWLSGGVAGHTTGPQIYVRKMVGCKYE